MLGERWRRRQRLAAGVLDHQQRTVFYSRATWFICAIGFSQGGIKFRTYGCLHRIRWLQDWAPTRLFTRWHRWMHLSPRGMFIVQSCGPVALGYTSILCRIHRQSRTLKAAVTGRRRVIRDTEENPETRAKPRKAEGVTASSPAQVEPVVSSESEEDDEGRSERAPSPVVLRRSEQRTAGLNTNPFRLPRSAKVDQGGRVEAVQVELGHSQSGRPRVRLQSWV
ncbi:hypothetical protein DPEC_G00374170 [Dallia pectoralis]|nr:hypothetical protein DPEC_G00374170 [Dallia pectoralis]